MYRFDPNEDPAVLSKRLWQEKIPHRIAVDGEHEVLWLVHENDRHYVDQLIQQWHDPTLISQDVSVKRTVKGGQSLVWYIQKTPITCCILLLSALVALITEIGANLHQVAYLSIVPFQVFGNQIHFQPMSLSLQEGQWWRVITPSFLHFSVLHLVFNALWIWELGRKIELMVGKWLWLLGFVAMSVASNLVQFYWQGYPLFGGLSGVVYGAVGFAWLTPIFLSKWPRLISKPLMLFFLVWLLIGYTPIPESIGLGNIANTAHLIGLVSGCTLSFFYGVFMKLNAR